MSKQSFYEIQAESFRDYSTKYSNRELLSVFNEWAESKDIYGVDKQEIQKIVLRFIRGR